MEKKLAVEIVVFLSLPNVDGETVTLSVLSGESDKQFAKFSLNALIGEAIQNGEGCCLIAAECLEKAAKRLRARSRDCGLCSSDKCEGRKKS